MIYTTSTKGHARGVLSPSLSVRKQPSHGVNHACNALVTSMLLKSSFSQIAGVWQTGNVGVLSYVVFVRSLKVFMVINTVQI